MMISGEYIDLVIIDLNMPLMDGYEVIFLIIILVHERNKENLTGN